MFLKNNLTGFYFENYPSKLPVHANRNKNICVLAVNSSPLFWIRSLFNGKFKNYPAVKLYGELGQRREAAAVEIKRLNNRMKTTKGLKGNNYLWGEMKFVREIAFTKAEKINLGKMTAEL